MNKLLLGFIGTLFLVLTSCTTAKPASSIPKYNIKEIVKSEDVVLLDVRIPEEYAEATANNAINIPLDSLQNNIESLKGKKVVVFCNRGMQADKAVDLLSKNGIEVYDGTTWKNVKAIQQEK